jgi:tellurite resistance protein TehA-like permease
MARNPKRAKLFLSILFLLAIIIFSLLWPQAARPLAWTVLCLGLGLAIFATVRADYQPYKQGLIPRRSFVRSLVIDLVGLLLSTLAAISAASWAGSAAARAVWEAAGLLWVALLVSLTAGLAAGLGAGALVRFLWGRLFRSKRGTAHAHRRARQTA